MKNHDHHPKIIHWIIVLFLVLANTHLYSRQKAITGTVKDTRGVSLPGVTVSEKDGTNATVTDLNGKFSLTLNTARGSLVFTFLGFKKLELPVTGENDLQVVLEEDAVGLQEVVVVGYGTQRKGDVTSAVASIKSENFTAGAVRDASEAIRGKVAGVSISSGSGDPSAGSNISLRGIASLQGGTTPLILINGIPGSFNTIAPEEIESIDILKDASAAAIYGTRGANGVILITTKTAGRDAPTTLTYSGYASRSSFAARADFFNAGEMKQLLADGKRFPYADEGYNTNWLDEISRDGYMQNHNVNMKGGSRTSNYVANLNYNKQDGVFNKSYNEELKASLDIYHYMFNDRLKLNFNIVKGLQNLGALGDGASFNSTIYRQALIRNPTDRLKNDADKWIETSRFQYYNPVAMIEETDGVIENEWTRLTANAGVDIIKGWNANLMVATHRNTQFRGYSESKQHFSNTLNGRNGFASRGDADSKTDYLEMTTKYTTDFSKHRFTVLGGYSYQYNLNEGGWANNYDFPTDSYSYDNLGAGKALLDGRAGMDSYKNDNRLIGFFGRLNYGYDNRYNLLASVRREGSSKFGDNNKWGTFPSVSAGWTINNESFMSRATSIDLLKLRAGFGITGITPADSYLSKTRLSYQGYFYNNGEWVQGLVPASNPNPDLRWEKSREVNIGLDFSFFSSRINGSIDVYDKKTSDMLWNYNVPTPPYLYSTILANVGEMSNKGVEILLNTSPVKTKFFQWTSSMTFSHNKNKLLSLSNDLFEIDGNFINVGDTGDPISFSTHRLEVGKPIGNFWGLKSVDITDAGKWVIETTDGTRKTLDATMYNDPNKQYLGNGIPGYYAGWTNTVNYKNFDLSLVLTGAFDFQILNFQRMFYENPTINYNMLTSAFDNVYGKTPLNYSQTFVSYYIEDGDYLKVDNITLGYNVRLTNLKYIKALRFYTSGANLGYITGYKGLDPEITRNDVLSSGNDSRDKYPSIRTFTFGINATF